MSNPSLGACIRSRVFISHVIWCSLLTLRFSMYINTLNPTLVMLLNEDKRQINHYTDVSTYTFMAGAVLGVFAGWFCDFSKKNISKDGPVHHQNLLSTVVPQVVTISHCVILSAPLLVEDQLVLYQAFVLFTLFRLFVFTVAASFLSAMYPVGYFGALFGIMLVTSGPPMVTRCF